MRATTRAASAAIMTAVLGCIGCTAAHNGDDKNLGDCYRNWVDEAWPYRYDYAARQSVLEPFAQQAANGHFLEQTLWNWYFEPGSDRLTPGGIARLDAIARSTPVPDPKLYIQTARDIAATSDAPEKVHALRDDLNFRRALAIKQYMSSQPGIIPMPYEVFVTDAPVPGIYSAFAAQSFRAQIAGYTGTIAGGSGAAAPVPGGGPQGPGATGIAPSPGGAPGSSAGPAPAPAGPSAGSGAPPGPGM